MSSWRPGTPIPLSLAVHLANSRSGHPATLCSRTRGLVAVVGDWRGLQQRSFVYRERGIWRVGGRGDWMFCINGSTRLPPGLPG